MGSVEEETISQLHMLTECWVTAVTAKLSFSSPATRQHVNPALPVSTASFNEKGLLGCLRRHSHW